MNKLKSKKMKKFFVVFVMSFTSLFVQSQDTCSVANMEVVGTLGGAWLRQSFTLDEDISHPYVSIPVYAPATTFMVRISLYQGSVWDSNPILLGQTVEGPVVADPNGWWPDIAWFGISIPNITLTAGQQYFLEIRDNAENVSVFSFGQAGFDDLFPGGEQRDPFTNQATTSVWFSDIAIRISGTCGEACLGDVNQDGIIGIADIMIILNTFSCVGGSCGISDLDSNGVVGASDLLIIMNLFGSSCN
jgi:hypothetical protein